MQVQVAVVASIVLHKTLVLVVMAVGLLAVVAVVVLATALINPAQAAQVEMVQSSSQLISDE